jgi:ClpP class serine protease
VKPKSNRRSAMGIFNRNKVSSNDISLELQRERLKELKAKNSSTRGRSLFLYFILAIVGLYLGFIIASPDDELTKCGGAVCITDKSKVLDNQGMRALKKSKNKWFVIEYKEGFSVDSAERFANKVDTILPLIRQGDVVQIAIESPGGSSVSCAHSYDYLKHIRARGAKIVATTDYIAASCGYMLMAGADVATAGSGAIVGNIGSVHIRKPGIIETLTNRTGGKTLIIGSTRQKELLAGATPRTEEDIAFLKGRVIRGYNDFVSRVIERRGGKITNKPVALSGDAFSGNEALKLGLIDSIADTRGIIRSSHIRGYQVYIVTDNVSKNPVLRMLLSYMKK